MKIKNKDDLIEDIILYTVLSLLTIICIYPVWYVIAASFASSLEIAKNPGFLLWPKDATLGAYRMVFKSPLILSGLKNSVLIIVIGLPINIVMTVLCGYFLSCSGMLFKKGIAGMIMFTMFFSGGLIPAYLNIRDLGLYNTIAALILPGALNVYNAVICKTAIEGVPESLSESAYLDGANDFQVLFKIIIPLIKPTLAVLLLYYGVAHWNGWFNASIYIREDAKLPVQNIIRSIMLANQDLSGAAAGDNYNNYAETIKYAACVIATFPIMCIYPFLQKYFAKGVMIGAVKG